MQNKMASMRYWLTAFFVGFVCTVSVAAFLTELSAKASGLCRRELNART